MNLVLKEYLDNCGMSQVEVAMKIGVSSSMITEVLMERKRFGIDNGRKLVALAGGKLTLDDVIPPNDDPQEKAS
jgi:plasmid maintenance system antidote protein VapI